MGWGIAAKTPPNFPAEDHTPFEYSNVDIENTDINNCYKRIFSNSLHYCMFFSEHNSL
jgi:hypothetical protein